MSQIVKKQQSRSGRWYAILRDRKATFAVCWQDSFSWKFKDRHLTLAQAEDMLSLYAA